MDSPDRTLKGLTDSAKRRGSHNSLPKTIRQTIKIIAVSYRVKSVCRGDAKMSQELLSSVPGLRECRQHTLGDPEICIAIIDSRFERSHPCFAGARLREIVPMWLRSIMGPDGAAHGTHIASVIFGQPGGPVDGIAPRCQGIVIPVYGETEDGELRPCSQEDLGRAISLALEAGAHLINISGGELIEHGEVDPLLAKIVSSCERQDVAIIAATGNEGCECLHVPASLPTTLAVGASDANGQPMHFSNWDESLGSHGILAPGEGVLGAAPGGGVAAHSGTSFACPVVTGAAALLLSLQKLNGEKASPTAVRDAIITSAIPCGPQDQAQCERMLGGRLNVHGAYEALFPSENVPRAGAPTNAIRAPPVGIAPAAWLRRNGKDVVGTGEGEGDIMASEHFQGQPQGGATVVHGIAPQIFEAPQQQGEHAHSPAAGALTPASSAVPGVAPIAAVQPMAAAAPPMAVVAPPAAVRPQGASGGCSCGGAQSLQGMNPSQQEGMPAQHDAGSIQQPSATAYHGGIPMQAPYGTQPAWSPAQRTAMLAGYPGSGAGQHMTTPAGRGVMPSQQSISGCPCPLPNDFIWCENSQLIYVIGTLGYDFITDARRDYFVQAFADLSDDHDYVALFKQTLGLQPGPTYFPEDHRFMAAYLNTGLYVAIPPDFHGGGAHFREAVLAAQARALDAGGVVWVLFQENQPLYALRPLQTFAREVLLEFANFLFNQSRPDNELDAEGDEVEPQKVNSLKADRVSIAGRVIGDITLYNGQRVPVLDVSTRALFQWTIELLIADIAKDHPEVLVPDSPLHQQLTDLLERIYYEVRNLGQAPSDRAINFMATNILEASNVIAEAVSDHKVLDSIYAEKSPLCRPKSLCFDVIMRFFDPEHRLEKALDEYRLTLDVSDIAPVPIGKRRKWARFA